MATLTERLALLISADVQGATRGLNEVGKASKKHLGDSEKRVDKMGRTFSKVGATMLAVGGAAAVGLYKTVEAASDLEQAVGGTEAVFKSASGVIDEYAQNSAQAAGLSERAFREATTQIGGNLKRMGFSIDEAAEQSSQLTQTAADLAATYGGTTAEAVSALGAAFRGEADPAERFNLNLKASAVNAKAVALGLAESTSEVSEQARAQALLALITEQSADATGQFAREAGSAAGATQIASAEFENARAALGESLAPVMADAAGLAANLFDKFSDLNESTDGLASRAIGGVTGLTLVGGAALTAAGKMIELNRSLRDVDGNLTRTGRNVGRVGKAIGALVAVGLAIELTKWAEGLGDVNFEIERALGLSGQKQAEAFKEKIAEITAETGTFELSWKALGRDIQRNNPFGEDWNANDEAREFFDELLDTSIATAEAFREAAAADSEFQAKLNQHGLTQEYLTGKIDEATEAAVNQGNAQERTSEIIDAAAGKTEGLGGALQGLVGDTAAEALRLIGDTAGEAVDPIEAMEQAIKDVNDALKAQFDPLFAAQDALLDNRDAQQAVADAEWAVVAAMVERDKIIKGHGPGSEEAKEAAENLSAAERQVADAERALAKAAKSRDDAIAEHGANSDEARDAADSFRDAELSLKDAQDDVAKAMAERNRIVKGHGENSDEAREADEALAAARRDLDDANRKVVRSAIDVSAATNELKTRMEEGDVSIEGAKNQLALWVEQGLLTDEQAKNTAVELGLVAWEADELGRKNIMVPVGMDKSDFDTKLASLTEQISGLTVGAAATLVLRDEALAGRFNNAIGGPVPGPRGAPVHGTAHGGEYVLSADVVDAIKRGAPSRGRDAAPAFAGSSDSSLSVQIGQIIAADSASVTKSMVRELRREKYLTGL